MDKIIFTIGFKLVNLFTSSAGTRMEELLTNIDSRVTQDMNDALCKEFTSKEVIEALESIGDLKAPGQMVCHQFSTRNFGTL
jgi:hypothetical protein